MKPLRVDNWANFLLQRLNSLYETGEQCDLVLLFETGTTIKVHSLVVNACTNFFQTIENRTENSVTVLTLPNTLEENILEPIIKFMYTGILELCESTFEMLYQTAAVLKMNLLTKLLDARRNMSDVFGNSDLTAEETHHSLLDSNIISRHQNSLEVLQGLTDDSEFTTYSNDLKLTMRPRRRRRKSLSQNGSIDCTESDDKQLAKVKFNLGSDFKYPNIDEKSQDKEQKIVIMESQNQERKFQFINNLEGPSLPKKQFLESESILKSSFQEQPFLINETEHQKILAEVMKKHPGLAKDGDQLQLKIVQRTNNKDQIKLQPSKSNGRKVAYLVLKSLTPTSTSIQNFESKNVSVSLNDISDVSLENPSNINEDPPGSMSSSSFRTWNCKICQESGYSRPFQKACSFRKHLLDVHQHDVAYVCIHCGTLAPKRFSYLNNQVLRHDTNWPEAISSSRCTHCQYVAVSESLVKTDHKNNLRDFCCPTCGATFMTQEALDIHMKTNLHSLEYKSFKCPHCELVFSKGFNLKAHLKYRHRNAPLPVPLDLDAIDAEITFGRCNTLNCPVTNSTNFPSITEVSNSIANPLSVTDSDLTYSGHVYVPATDHSPLTVIVTSATSTQEVNNMLLSPSMTLVNYDENSGAISDGSPPVILASNEKQLVVQDNETDAILMFPQKSHLENVSVEEN